MSINLKQITLGVIFSLLCASCYGSNVTSLKKPDDKFYTSNIRTIDLRFQEQPYRPNAPRDWQYVINHGKNIYNKYVKENIISKLNDKGYKVKIGDNIIASYAGKWRWGGVYGGAEPILEKLSINADAILLFQIYHINIYEGYDNPLQPNVYVTLPIKPELSFLSISYYVFDQSSKQKIIANVNSGSRTRETLSKSKERVGNVTRESERWRFIESENDFCKRLVNNLLDNLPNAKE